MSRPLQPLDPTWWRTHRYEQQDGRASLHKLRTGRHVTGWAIYVYEAGNTHGIGEFRTFEQAKRRGHEITSDPTRLSELRGEQGAPWSPMDRETGQQLSEHRRANACDEATQLNAKKETT